MDDREARFRAEGWAWGFTHGGEWLTIAGSALRTAEFSADPANAVPPSPIIGETHILARVRRHGTWFRILELAPEHMQHTLITARDDKYAHLVTGWCSCSKWAYDHRTQSSVFVAGWRSSGSARLFVVQASYEYNHARQTRAVAV